MKGKDYKYLIGKKYNKLLVLSDVQIVNGRKKVECLCECGIKKFIRVDSIKNQISCGCYIPSHKGVHNSSYKDGRSADKLYNVWFAIKNRINSPKCKEYKYYGGRGIKMCDEWYDYAVFKKWAFGNGYKDGLTIEREKVNEDYCPENCSWITKLEQAQNKRNTVYIYYRGQKKTIRQWCEELNLKYGTERSRVYRNFYRTGKLKLSVQ
jgi:hypothetical protein